jgi:hypothetical protein
VVEGIINFEPVDRWVEHFWREWELLKPTNITNSREKFESGFLKHVEEYLDEVVAAANVDSEKSESEISRENSEEDEEDKYTVKRLLDQQKKLVAQQRNLVDRVGNVCEMIKSLVAEFAALKKEVRQMGDGVLERLDRVEATLRLVGSAGGGTERGPATAAAPQLSGTARPNTASSATPSSRTWGGG